MKIKKSKWRDCLPAEAIMLAVMGFLPGAVICKAQVPRPRNDFQGWTDLNESHPLGERTDLVISGGLRYGDDQGHLIFRRIASGFAFHLYKHITIEPYYQHSVSDTILGPQTSENRLTVATTIGTSWKHWKISDRNTGERRFIEAVRDWRYRNRVEFRRDIAMARKQVTVFTWDEVFYSSTLGKWYRNRVALGVGRKISNRISIDIYYVRQNDGYSRPGDLNALGMSLKTRF